MLISFSLIRMFKYVVIRNHKSWSIMNTKLTLKLNKRVIERAKRYAKNKNQSLSGIVENFFEIILENDLPNDMEISPKVLELAGIIKLSNDINIKESTSNSSALKYLRKLKTFVNVLPVDERLIKQSLNSDFNDF